MKARTGVLVMAAVCLVLTAGRMEAADLNRELLKAAVLVDSGKIEGLLSRGADPNARYKGTTALIMASHKGRSEMEALLGKAGAK